MKSVRVFLASALSFGALLAPSLARADEPAPSAPMPPLLPSEPVLITPAPPPPPSAARSVVAHVAADDPVLLQFLSPDETRWRTVCASPCDTAIPLDGVYRVVAHGMQTSRTLEIEAEPGAHVLLKVHAKSNDDYATAERLGIAVYVTLGVGLALEVAALAVNSSSDAEPALLWSGIGVAAVGVSMEIASLVLRQPTTISQSVVAAGGTARARSPWIRSPMWHDLKPASQGAPVVTSVPVFSTTF